MSIFKRVFLLISTGVCGVIGISMITLGAKEIMDGTYIDGFAKEHRYITAVFISLGVVIFLISAIGFLAVILQNNTLLRTYAYLMLTLIVIQVLTGFLILLFIDDIRNSMYNKLNEKFKNYKENAQEVDQLQLILKCCGMAGARNWNVTSLPSSCCGVTTGNCTVSAAYPDSCTQKSENVLVTTLYVQSISSLIIVLFEIICIVLACCLNNAAIPTQTRRQLSPKFGKRKRSSDESSSSSSSSSSSNEEQKKKNINEDKKKIIGKQYK